MTTLKIPAQAAKAVESEALEPEALKEYPTYRAGRLTQFFTNDGTSIEPEAGIYTARTEEQFDLLNYYAAKDAGLVTPLF